MRLYNNNTTLILRDHACSKLIIKMQREAVKVKSIQKKNLILEWLVLF